MAGTAQTLPISNKNLQFRATSSHLRVLTIDAHICELMYFFLKISSEQYFQFFSYLAYSKYMKSVS